MTFVWTKTFYFGVHTAAIVLIFPVVCECLWNLQPYRWMFTSFQDKLFSPGMLLCMKQLALGLVVHQAVLSWWQS